MGNSITSYLRTHRRRSGLTQLEVAYLLRLKSGQTVSRYECLDRTPSLETMFAYQIVFDAMPHELTPGLYEKVETITMQRIHVLADQLADDAKEGLALRKHDVLKQTIERVGSRRTRL